MPSGCLPLFQSIVDYGWLLAVSLNCCWLSLGCLDTMSLGCWRSYDFIRPVLKHGPRSLTCVRVFGWLKPMGTMKVKAACSWSEISLWERIIDRPLPLIPHFPHTLRPSVQSCMLSSSSSWLQNDWVETYVGNVIRINILKKCVFKKFDLCKCMLRMAVYEIGVSEEKVELN